MYIYQSKDYSSYDLKLKKQTIVWIKITYSSHHLKLKKQTSVWIKITY